MSARTSSGQNRRIYSTLLEKLVFSQRARDQSIPHAALSSATYRALYSYESLAECQFALVTNTGAVFHSNPMSSFSQNRASPTSVLLVSMYLIMS